MFTKSKFWAVSLLVAVATAGFASGAATMGRAGDKRCDGRERLSYSGMLQRELGLTDAQRESVRIVVRRHRQEMRAVYEIVRPRMDSIRAQIAVEVRGILTAEQQAGYERLLERQRLERMRHDSAAGRNGGR
jgi:Spy/CpxP family protein refolding chaperone